MKKTGQGNPTTFSFIAPEVPIIGFTGALGSGCTFLAKGLEKHQDYAYCSLSKPIHDALGDKENHATSKELQDKGDELREKHGPDYLVKVVLDETEAGFTIAGQRPKGLVVDGIRNTAEVTALRAWPHFYLFSVQASQELRKQRVLAKGNRCKNETEFLDADTRDAEEQTTTGQQVSRCNYLSDIIVLNETEISTHAKLTQRRYISDTLVNPYIMLIENLARGGPPPENKSRVDEALMTTAYVESKRSSCVKRKVGAVIATQEGDILTAGHNDVPNATKPCIEDARYRWCARDVLQEKIAQGIAYCPKCGKRIKLKVVCPNCGTVTDRFVKRCPQCGVDLNISYTCPAKKCKAQVFAEFLPGADAERTGKLLDMCRSLHAEENAILSLSKAGMRIPEGAVLYSTTFPCNLCANKIVTIGIKTVVYAEPYTMKEAKKVFEDRGVVLRRFAGVKSNAYFRLYS